MFSTNSTPFNMPVVPAYCNGGGFGDGNGAWWLIVLIILFGGWGGYGRGGYGGGQVGDNYILASDMSQLSRQISDSTAMTERKLDSISNGICSLGYDQLSQMNGINTNILTTGNAIQVADMQGFNATQGAIKDCCCQTQQNIKDTQYVISDKANMLDRGIADGFCKTNYNNASNTRDIIDSQNNGTRAILDKLCQMESNAKDEKIAELTAKNFDLRLAASQEAQNRVLIGELGYQCPKPAYVVQPPQQVSFATNCGGVATFANGCGCGQYYNGTTIA